MCGTCVLYAPKYFVFDNEDDEGEGSYGGTLRCSPWHTAAVQKECTAAEYLTLKPQQLAGTVKIWECAAECNTLKDVYGSILARFRGQL